MFLDTRKVLQYSDLQRTYNWDILLPDIAGLAGEDVSVFVQDIDLGDYSLADTNPIRHGAFQTHSAGFLNIRPLSLTFLSPSNNIVIAYLQGWKGLIVSPEGHYYPKANYVQNAVVNQYDRLGNLTTAHNLINIFPTSFPNFKLSYAAEEMVKFNIEFSVDFIERIV